MPSPDATETRRLRIMVCPHELVMGGSQINAIDLAARLRDLGHTVVVFASPGPLQARIADLGLEFRAAPPRRGEADLRVVRAFARELRAFKPDIVYTFESAPTIQSALAAWTLPHRSVTTVMSMSVPDYIPEHVPMTVGTGALAEGQRGRIGDVHLLEPPIDTDADAPADKSEARAVLGLDRDAFVVAVVGRLSGEHHKARGIVEAIDALAVAELPGPLTLVVAGDGDEAESVRLAAGRANLRGNGLTVRLEGNVTDPRPVYDAADVMFGMGGSALRAMSHEKPLIVQGRNGFWELLTVESAPRFKIDGYFGEGQSGGPSVDEIVLRLMSDAGLRRELGLFGRQLVVREYSLDQSARRLQTVFLDEQHVVRSTSATRRSLVRSYRRYAIFRVARALPGIQRAYRRMTGRHE